VGRALDSQLDGCEFDSRSSHCRVATLGKLFTPVSPLQVAMVYWQNHDAWLQCEMPRAVCVYNESHCDGTALVVGCAPLLQ